MPPPRAADLLRWYDTHGRDLPWRTKGGLRPDPYHVWLSEIMLQQTMVATVTPYYAAFLKRWPTVNRLAAADLNDVLAAWAGLGYYRRAHNLHRCARLIVSDYGGSFPADLAGLKSLPGVGEYTAAAIAAIAFGQSANVVDGNVERVMARLFRVVQPLPAAKPLLRAHAATLLPVRRFGDYAQALMDLGATICTPRQPRCPVCPWRSRCQAYRMGETALYPVMARKAERPIRYAVAYWLEDPEGKIWLRRREDQGLLAGMVEIPSTPWTEQAPSEAAIVQLAPASGPWQEISQQIRHTFTHFDLYIRIRHATSAEAAGNGFWSAPDALKGLALPSVMRKIAAAALKRGNRI